MIDLDRLEMDCKIAIANGSKYLPATKIDTAQDMLELVTRLRQSEKDAERYRLLREIPATSGPLVMKLDCNGELNLIGDDELDSAIDEIMNGSDN